MCDRTGEGNRKVSGSRDNEFAEITFSSKGSIVKKRQLYAVGEDLYWKMLKYLGVLVPQDPLDPKEPLDLPEDLLDLMVKLDHKDHRDFRVTWSTRTPRT